LVVRGLIVLISSNPHRGLRQLPGYDPMSETRPIPAVRLKDPPTSVDSSTRLHPISPLRPRSSLR
jgi:hypothetical protein